MRTLSAFVMTLLLTAAAHADVWGDFIERATQTYGDAGTRAARFLAAHRPARDAEIDLDLLMENLEFALRARGSFAWARQVPEDRFLNDVLPYASLDETRESWRPEFFETCAEIVRDCRSAEEAAQAINRELFNEINVHYNTGRKKPNQSPSESIAQGRATCTGLSVILVDGCRAVGIPARIAGVANWADKRGNHTWVEIHDGTRWRFTGADEYNDQGLDRAWFQGDAERAVAGSEEHAVWASSWRGTAHHFPMVWNRGDTSVPAVDVTHRYAKAPAPDSGDAVTLFLRAVPSRGGDRIAVEVRVDGADPVRTRSGTADMNDMATLVVPTGGVVTLQVKRDEIVRTATFDAPEAGSHTIDLVWDELAMSREDARATVERVASTVAASPVHRQRLDDKVVTYGDASLRWLERRFGTRPDGGHSLWISLHGGGGTSPATNDRQWNNQIGLYAPEEGIYVAPRAPSNTWNMWHQAHVDPLLDALIGSYVAAGEVNPDRVYLIGYSAGGDGVYQLAPRLADRFAAASMMAGHPNEAQPFGLRNLPFAILMGGLDGAYDRNTVARTWGDRLEELAASDPGGYPNRTIIYEDCGHWMQGRDAEILPWLASHTRDPWPSSVVWYQDDVTHARFYWLEVRPEDARAGVTVRASVDGQTIDVHSDDVEEVTLRLHDRLIDLDTPITVRFNGEEVFADRVDRTEGAITRSMRARVDPASAASAHLTVRR